MSLPVESLDQRGPDEDLLMAKAEWAEEIRRRVNQIRSGTAGRDLQEVVAELDRCEAEFAGSPMDDAGEDPDDPAEVAAWEDEIGERLKEIREGTVKTYAAEDVMAALRARFG
jgi:hypothetical protein